MPENYSPPFALAADCLARKTVTPRAERNDGILGKFIAGGFLVLDVLLWFILPEPFGYAAQLAILPAIAIFWFSSGRGKTYIRRRELWPQPFPAEYEAILLKRVPHYRLLDEPARELFRQRAKLFLDEIEFHGAGVKVTDGLRLRAAAAAIVPTLGFPEWQWDGLREIIFRPDGYADGSYTDPEDGVVTEFEESGMVGLTGVMSGVMMLASRDLVWEFAHPDEGYNVGFHEFAHVMSGGGLALLDPVDRRGWERLLARERKRLRRDDSLLDEYAFLNPDEFFAVSSELFFTVPHLLREWHRELHDVLVRAYRQEPCRWIEDFAPAPEPEPRRRRRRKRKE